jgi:hypothetical protein
VLTQRVQALHNALLGSCETMIAHRLTAPADQKPVIDWLKRNAGKDSPTPSRSSSPGCDRHGWMVSRKARPVFTLPEVPHLRQQRDADRGQHRASTSRPRRSTSDKLRQILGDAVKEAEENDPKLLRGQLSLARARIFELEHDKRSAPSAEEIERAEKRGYARARGEIASVEQIARDLRRSIGGVQDAIGICAAHAGNIEAALAERGTVTVTERPSRRIRRRSRWSMKSGDRQRAPINHRAICRRASAAS